MSDISLSFGGLRALNNVSIAADPGEVVGVIGPNGAGKTTLFNVLCGFVKPDTGSVSWRGTDFSPRPERLVRQGIARTMQGLGLCESLTVFENVQLGADHRRTAGFLASLIGGRKDAVSERDLRDRAWAQLERFGLTQLADASPTDLPYPERKRVALARALASDPDLLVLDEPAAGLGHSEIEELIEVITEFHKSGDRIVIVVDHHMDFVLRVCSRLYVLDAGKTIAEGPSDFVVSQPQVLEAYLGLEEAESTP
jgi:branched-chain amino acid transport system ATP-binding protein